MKDINDKLNDSIYSIIETYLDKWLSNSISEELDALVLENTQLIVYDSVSNLTQRVVTNSIGSLNE